jgi:hypothetical protein
LRFYVDQLGFALVVDENYESGGRWVAVAPPDGSTVLALVTPMRNSTKMLFVLESNRHHMAASVLHRFSGMDRKST